MKTIVLSSLGVILAGQVFANNVPVKSPKCKDKVEITSPENASGLYYNADCTVGFVLPPKKGVLSVANRAGELTNLGFCPAVKDAMQSVNDLQNASAAEVERINRIKKQINAYEQKVESEFDEMMALDDIELEILEKKDNLIFKQEELQSLTASKKEDLQECLDAGKTCRRLKRTVSQMEDGLLQIENLVKGADRELVRLEKRKERHQSTIDRYQARLEDYSDRISTIDNDISDVRKVMMDSYKEYIELPGINLKMEFYDDHANLVDQYKDLNSDSGITFVAMDIKEAKTSINASLGDDSVAGNYSLMVPAQVIPNISEYDAAATWTNFASNGSLLVTTNLMATCPYVVDGRFDDTSADRLKSQLNVNTLYNYEIQVYRGYQASYNLNRFFLRIRESSKKGGLFRSRSVTKVINKNEIKDEFEIEFFGDDGGLQYTPEEQAEIIKQEKANLIDRVLRQVLAISNVETGGVAPIPSTLPSGASVASQELQKCPHLYCQVGAAVLTVADAIFGSSKATSYFEQRDYMEANDIVKGRAMVDRYFNIGFF